MTGAAAMYGPAPKLRPAWRRLVARGLLAAAGAAGTAVALARLRQARASAGHPGPRWARTNFRGGTVDLAGGPAVAAAATLAGAAGAGTGAGAAALLVAGFGAGGVGLYDDLVGGRPGQQAKGFHGHLAALRRGRLTSGMVKLAGVGAAGLAAAALLPGRPGSEAHRPGTRWRGGAVRATEVLLGAGVIAGAANLLNLLDLRPGRALKVSLLAGAALLPGSGGAAAAGPLGAAVAGLPDDLAERTMLGDCGANALGALLGTVLVARTGPRGRAAALVAIGALTATSERVSFTRVIARTPGLRELDQLGRRGEPAGPAAGAAGAAGPPWPGPPAG